MKKVFLGLAVVALLFSFVACNSEPGSGGSTSVDGTWKAYYEDIEQQTPGEVKYAYFTVTVNGNNVSLEIACKDVNGDPVMGSYIGTYTGTITKTSATEGTYTITSYNDGTQTYDVNINKNWLISNGKLNIYLTDIGVPEWFTKSTT